MRAERRRQLTVNKLCTHRTRRTRCWDLSRLPFWEGAFATVYGMAPGNEREDRRDQRPARGAAAARGERCGGARRECQRAEGGRCGRHSLADRAPGVWSGERWACGAAGDGRNDLGPFGPLDGRGRSAAGKGPAFLRRARFPSWPGSGRGVLCSPMGSVDRAFEQVSWPGDLAACGPAYVWCAIKGGGTVRAGVER